MKTQSILRFALIALLVSMGLLHFLFPGPFVRAMPDYLPFPLPLVVVSGMFEIAGGVGLALRVTRKVAVVGVILLFLAVFPANVNMALHADQWLPEAYRWVLWVRLPLQIVLIWWAWRVRA